MTKQLDPHSTAPKPLFDTLEYTLIGYIPTCLNANFSADYQHALSFLHSYRGSEATFNAYRREVERLLHWSWTITKKPLNKLKRHDLESFIEFCQHPPQAWIGTKTVKRFIIKDGQRIANPAWRPFTATVTKTEQRDGGKQPDVSKYASSQKAVQAIFSVLGSFYNYLIQEDYIAYNPVAQIRQFASSKLKHLYVV